MTLRFLVTPESSQAFLQAKTAMLVALSKKVAMAPPCVFLVIRLLLHKGGTAMDHVTLALLVSDSRVTSVRTDCRMKEPSMFSGGIPAAYAAMYLRILSAIARSASECMAVSRVSKQMLRKMTMADSLVEPSRDEIYTNE